MKTKCILHRVTVGPSCQEGITKLGRLNKLSFLIARRIGGRMTGFNIGFMLRLLSQHPGDVCYPLAAKVELLDSVTKAEFKRPVPGYKD